MGTSSSRSERYQSHTGICPENLERLYFWFLNFNLYLMLKSSVNYPRHSILSDLPPRVLAKGKVLRELDISHNLFAQLPAKIATLRGLEELRINHNSLTSLESDQGEDPLGALTGLKYLSVKNNQLEQLPESFSVNLTSLTSLRLCNNKYVASYLRL